VEPRCCEGRVHVIEIPILSNERSVKALKPEGGDKVEKGAVRDNAF
jgi:hypothetical protein